MNITIFPAEWMPQSAVLMAWPHPDTDWASNLDEAQKCFEEIIATITRFEKVVLLVSNAETSGYFTTRYNSMVVPVVIATNDSWARDFGPVTVLWDGKPTCLDFKFNGWGLKFEADQDNMATTRLFESGIISRGTGYENHLDFVLEGGALESDGQGTLLTTSECLMSPYRNGELNKYQIETYLKRALGVKRVLWLNSGYLAGDDTDSHVDTLARFCNPETIAYVKSHDPADEHHEALQKMEAELMSFKTLEGKPYNLVPLPMAEKVMHDGYRLPATYANFLIINDAVLVPTYSSDLDNVALEKLREVFPEREIIGINCLPLIKQHGSLHCVTMQLPKGVIE